MQDVFVYDKSAKTFDLLFTTLIISGDSDISYD